MKKVAATSLVLGMLIAAAAGCSTNKAAVSPAKTEAAGVTTAEEETVIETEAETEAIPTWATYRKVPNPPVADGSRILFVGNSHTYVNDVPGLFGQLAEAAGHEVEVAEIVQGMYSLKEFADPADEEGAKVDRALLEEQWDVVVLQEKTASALSIYAEAEMYDAARDLDGRIKAAGGQTAFMMTWPMKEGAGPYSREAVYEMLAEGYGKIAEELEALLIPGGEVLMAVAAQNPELELWDEDEQHMSPAGSYMAACAAYATLFQESPEGNTFLGGLDEETAVMLQQTAAAIVLQ